MTARYEIAQEVLELTVSTDETKPVLDGTPILKRSSVSFEAP